MPARKGLLAPQNTFLDTIATRFDGTHSNFVLGNAKIAINPIVYCSDGFCDLTGYSRAHIMQKSCACNFLYGPRTDFRHKEAISRALEQKQELKLEVILYKRSGGGGTQAATDSRTPFWCLLDIVPIQDEKHEVVLFLCSHKDITKQKWHEEKEHELARLKQLKLASNATSQLHAAAATAADQHPASGEPPAATGKQRGSDQQECASLVSPSAFPAAPATTCPDQQLQLQQHHNQPNDFVQQQQQQSKLDDADDAELTALANQNALISMDEFRLDNFDDDEHEFDDDDDDEDHDKHTANQYSRRRSRAVLYQLSGHYGNRRSVNMKSKLKLNNRMNIPEYKTTTIEKQKFILSHYGIGKTCWDWLILVVSFYVAIVVPYNATFNNKQQDLLGGGKIDSIDIIVEVVFIIDVILNFRTTFVNRKGEVVTRPKIICRHYLRGWFMVDACAAVPFDLLCGLNIYDRKMDRYSQYSYIILTLLILIFSLLAHWCACIWYVIAMKEISAHPDWKIGWIHQLSDKLGYSVINATDLASSYVTALYFTTSSLTSVGFGNVSANTNAEKIFSIVIMLIGALMHAVVFGNVTALIRVMYARRSNYQTRLRDLKDFFRLHQLPKELQQRMSDYFQTTWSLNHGIETSEILRDFPEELRGDVSLHLHHEVLSLPIFETAPQGFLKSLAKHIESKFCCPTEYLIHRRDALNYLYLVCNGSMEVLQDNMVVAILGKGDLVGYDVSAQITADLSGGGNAGGTGGASGIGGGSVALVGGGGAKLGGGCQAPGGGGGLVKSSSDLKALTYCDLKCIHISGLLETLKLYPEFSDTFHREIVHDLSFNLRESHETTDNETTDDDDDEDADGDEDDEDDGDGGPHTLASPSSLLDGGGGDGDDEQGDGYTNGNGRKARGGRSPPPSIGHLYRSITGSGENQIGRYDHDDEDHGEANENERVRDELVEEDEDVDEDDDEEEDDDDEQDDDDEEEGHEGHDGDDNDHNGCSGGGGGSSTDGGAGAGGAAGSSEERRANGRALQSASSDESSGGNGASQTAGGIQQAAGGSGWNGVRVAKRNVADVDDNVSGDASKPVLRRRLTSGNIGAVPVDPAAAARRRRPRRRRSFCQENAEEDEDATDWQSARSCDGLASVDAVVSAGGRPAAAADDSVLLVLAKEKRAADVSGAAAVAPLALRSAIGGGPKLGSRSVKPPLSFDLSRNTTAIVDRRRRSAGCIPRPLLQGLAAANSSPAGTNSAATRRAKHSSLNHINEEPQVSRDQQQQPLATKRSSQRRANGQAASTRYHQPAVGKLTCSPSSTSCDNGATPTPPTSLDASAALDRRHLNELRSIDTRINGLEASVWDMRRELKRELRSELHQIRASIEQQLMQLVSDTVSWRQQASGNRRAGQTSAANVSTTSNSNFKTSRQQQQQRQNSFQSATCSSRPSAGSISQSNTDVRERTTISSSVVPQTSFSSSVAAATTITGRNDASAGHHQSASFGILPTNATTGRQVIGTSCSGGNQPLATPTKVRPLKKSQSSASFIKASGKLSISSDEHRALVWGELADSLSSCAKSDSVTASTSSIVVSLPAASSHVARVCNNASYGTTTSVITASATTSHQDLALGNAKSPATNSFLVNSNNTSNDSKHTTPLPMASGYLQHQFQDCTSLMRQSSSGATLNNTSDNDSGRSSSSTSMNIAGHLRNGHTVVAPASALITRSYPDWMQQQQQAIVHVSPDLCDTSPLGGRSAKMLLTTANCNNNNGEDGSCNDAQYTIDLDPVIGPKLPTPTGASSATGGSNIL